MKQNKQEEATEKVTVRMPSRSKEIFNLNYCILPIVYISIRIFIRFLFRTYFAQHTLVMEEAINGRVDYGFILVTRVFYPCTETTKFKKKKKRIVSNLSS